MQTNVYASVEDLNAALAEWICALIKQALSTKDQFTFCLSGGNTPKALYELLAEEYRDEIDWKKVHFFWGDERYVPFNDERNNAGMASKALLDKIEIDKGNIHIIRTDIDAKESAIAYDKLLHSFFDGEPTTFDLVLLGMGDDGHTLSLFPGNDDVNANTAWVTSVVMPKNTRITLTPPVINQAATVVFLIAGDSKSEVLERVLDGPYLPSKYPSQLIKKQSNNLYFFIDEAAAKGLED